MSDNRIELKPCPLTGQTPNATKIYDGSMLNKSLWVCDGWLWALNVDGQLVSLAEMPEGADLAPPTDAECAEALSAVPLEAAGDYGTPLDCLGALLNEALSGAYAKNLKKYLYREIATIRRALQRQSVRAQVHEAMRYGKAALESALGIAYVTFSTEDGLGHTNDKSEQLHRVKAALALIDAQPTGKSEYERGLEDAAVIVDGEPVDGNGRYVQWPAYGTGNRSVNDEAAKLTQVLAAAIRAKKSVGS